MTKLKKVNYDLKEDFELDEELRKIYTEKVSNEDCCPLDSTPEEDEIYAKLMENMVRRQLEADGIDYDELMKGFRKEITLENNSN